MNCESCGEANFVDDYQSGDVVCRTCGLVQMERVLNEAVPKRPADTAEAYDMLRNTDSVSSSMEMLEKRPKRSREIEALMRKVGEDLFLTPRSIDVGYECFKRYKSQRGVNKHTHTLALAAMMLAIDLRGEVCTFSHLSNTWAQHAQDYEIKRSVVERCEGELLKFLKTNCSNFVNETGVKNSVYIQNLMTRLLRDIETVAVTDKCSCSRDQCVCDHIRTLYKSTVKRPVVVWINDLCHEYNRINKLLNPKKKLKPLVAIAANMLFSRTIPNFDEELRLTFNTIILAPRTDVEYTSINYLARKLGLLNDIF